MQQPVFGSWEAGCVPSNGNYVQAWKSNTLYPDIEDEARMAEDFCEANGLSEPLSEEHIREMVHDMDLAFWTELPQNLHEDMNQTDLFEPVDNEWVQRYNLLLRSTAVSPSGLHCVILSKESDYTRDYVIFCALVDHENHFVQLEDCSEEDVMWFAQFKEHISKLFDVSM